MKIITDTELIDWGLELAVTQAYPCFCGRESCTEELKTRATLDGAERCTHGEPLDMRCSACLADPMNDFLREGIYDVSDMD